MAIVHFAQPAAPLAGHAAGRRAFLGERAGVEDEDGFGVREFLAHMAAEFVEDGLIVPTAGAHEQLQGAALLAGLGGDGLRGLAFQAGQLAAQDRARVLALFSAVKARQVTAHEGFQVIRTRLDVRCRQLSICQQGLGVGMFQQFHKTLR